MLNLKQKKFCDEYLVDFNATQAAFRAGYSKETARSIGSENLTKPDIKAYISERLKELSLGPEEVKKMISDVAKGSLNEYFTIKQIEHTPRISRPLKLLIKDLENEIEFEEEFAKVAKLKAEAKKEHQAVIDEKKLQIIRYQIELRRNSKAFRIVNGATILIDHAELDMVKLVKDKERGRIKSISHTPHGPRVEMYPADAAMRDVAKMHNLFKDEDEVKPVSITINGKGVKVN